jgi:DNA-binding CsgD family transcriptional regulator
MRGFNFDTGDREFSERDRTVLRLLYPYLLNAARAREARPAVRDAAQSLSARERQVLAELARGRTSRGIGEALGISPRTVDKHLERIFEKLGVRTRAAAVAIALGPGLAG